MAEIRNDTGTFCEESPLTICYVQETPTETGPTKTI